MDGWVLPDDIQAIVTQKKHNNVSVLVGSNANEMTSLVGSALAPKTMEEYRRRIETQYGDLATEFEAAYGVTGEADIAEAMLGAARDTTFTLHMRTWARLTVAAGSKAYLYSFSHIPPHPHSKALRAFHAGELPYVFDALGFGDPREANFTFTDVDRRLAAQMSSYWANFVKTGDPNGRGLPTWTPYDPQNEAYLDFGDPVRERNHLRKAQLDFLEKVQARVTTS